MINDDLNKGRYDFVSRDTCNERGYHRVNSDKDKGAMVCYDCDLFFDKKFANEQSVEYRVVPRDSKKD